jgi:hypothetical protein
MSLFLESFFERERCVESLVSFRHLPDSHSPVLCFPSLSPFLWLQDVPTVELTSLHHAAGHSLNSPVSPGVNAAATMTVTLPLTNITAIDTLEVRHSPPQREGVE